MKLAITLCFCTLLDFSCILGENRASAKVHQIDLILPKLAKVNITKPQKFMNDLMLSPMWKVEKNRDGFVAKARSIEQKNLFDGLFLFELMAKSNRRFSSHHKIHHCLHGRDIFFTIELSVVFQKPHKPEITFGKSEQKSKIKVYNSFEDSIGPNSYSYLAIKLSLQHEIYVIIREQGADLSRKTTLKKVVVAMDEITKLASLANEYWVKEYYKDFFQFLFKRPLMQQEIKRIAGNQDRDTFYGYLQSQPNKNYAGVNIKISHPVYCPSEGTSKHARLAKAEYLGVPYHMHDILFFLIEDNAVYLPLKYSKQFGTFSGKTSFNGNLEILNIENKVLLKTVKKFKGWER